MFPCCGFDSVATCVVGGGGGGIDDSVELFVKAACCAIELVIHVVLGLLQKLNAIANFGAYLLLVGFDTITRGDCVTIRLSQHVKTGSPSNIINLVAAMQAQRLSSDNWNNITDMIDGDPSPFTLDDATNVAGYYLLLLSLAQ